jgi:competence protein ComEC
VPKVISERLDAIIAEQRRVWPVWLSIAFGTGIAVYFALPAEPAWFIGAAAFAVFLSATIFLRRIDLAWAVELMLCAAAAGFAASQLRTAQVTGVMLPAPLERALYVGIVEEIELLPAGQRVTLRDIDIKDQPRAATPQRIRIRVVVNQPELRIGQKVGGVASLNAPGGPAAPGAFDFRRQAFFDGLGATGFGYGRLKILKEPEAQGLLSTMTDAIARLRAAIAQRIRAQLPEATGAVAIALTVGDQTALRAADINAMRDSGLAHLLSISGLHIGLAAGLFFFGIRFALAFVPWIALRYPVKKWAAAVAICAALLYAGLAGWTTPTQRSVIMAGIAFLAIILDRSPISLQLVAWAAFLVLLFQPESLLGASFQMSFAAVFALVVAFEKLGPWFAARRQRWGEGATWDAKLFNALSWLFVWLGATVMTSIVAGFATLPFALYHFDRISVFGIVANAIAVPLTGIWVMPWAALSLVLMPFGLEEYPLIAMGWGCDALLLVAHWVSDWPGAIVVLPALSPIALPLLAAGLLWLGLARGRLRWGGVAPLVAGLSTIWLAASPDLLISPSGKLIAFRTPQGDLMLSSNRAERLVRETWLRRNGQLRFDDIADLKGDESWLRCADTICDYAGRVRVFLADTEITDCGTAALAIAPKTFIRGACPGSKLDKLILNAAGAVAIYFKDSGIEIVTAKSEVGDRPWALPDFSLNDEVLPQ